jgi:hypothetical protein
MSEHEFTPENMNNERNERELNIHRAGDYITRITLHTPGERALDVIRSVKLKIGSQLVWGGSTLALHLHDLYLCGGIPRSEDDSHLTLSVCGDISGGEGIPLVYLRFYHVSVAIDTVAVDTVVNLTAEYRTDNDITDERDVRVQVGKTFNAIQIQETEIVLDDTGACVAEPLPFHHNLAYLIVAFRDEDAGSGSGSGEIFGFDPLMSLALMADGSRIVYSNQQDCAEQQTMVQRLPCGAYLMNMDMNVSENCRLTISLSSRISRGKVLVVAMNRSELRCKYGLGHMVNVAATPATLVSLI